ncbi:MAG TPA: transcriptional repressor LexA [Myxococcota bacterium]
MTHPEPTTNSPDPSTLTDRQKLVLSFIEGHIREHGFPPTIREIGRHLGIKSTNGVNDHLNALQKKGFLTREEGKSRTLQLTAVDEDVGSANDDVDSVRNDRLPGLLRRDDDDFVDVPLLGKVAAGVPILAEQTRSDTVRVSSFFLGGAANKQVFALTVVGDSMIEDGIFEGDYLFVKKQPVARTGEIVVAMIEGEATVKRYFPEGDRIRFQPANSRLKPIYVDKSEFRQTDILGIVVGVYRKV